MDMTNVTDAFHDYANAPKCLGLYTSSLDGVINTCLSLQSRIKIGHNYISTTWLPHRLDNKLGNVHKALASLLPSVECLENSSTDGKKSACVAVSSHHVL